ncbi:hypothetical protein FBU31_007913, partial [Coemansia sp. 'formosensis']
DFEAHTIEHLEEYVDEIKQHEKEHKSNGYPVVTFYEIDPNNYPDNSGKVLTLQQVYDQAKTAYFTVY